MDYIKLRSIHHFTELACLCNVNNGKDFAEILDAPATRDVLMEITHWSPSLGMPPITLQYHFVIVPDTGKTGVAESDRLTPFDAVGNFSTRCEYKGIISRQFFFTAYITPTADAMVVKLGALPNYAKSDAFNRDRDVEQIGRAFTAFMELNWLILHQPSAIKESRVPAGENHQHVMGRASGKKKAAKGRTKVYLRMLTVPPEKSPDWESLKAKTPEAVQERAAREITCPVWEVRGHMRHYKSGKTVYVAPYRKGKERDRASAVSGKEYVLTGGNHAGKD
jgi:hypothetical protein